jgi:fatty-acyl-CoA synthase
MIHGDWLARREMLTPNKTALIVWETSERVSYCDLNARANRMANFLHQRLGIAQGDRVSILAANSAEYLALLFACGKLGAILVPLNWRLTARELAFMVNDSAPKALFYGPEYAAVVDELRPGVEVRQFVALDQARPGDVAAYAGIQVGSAATPPPAVEFGPEQPWAILYTGGTTGLPKGAILTHGNITWNSINTIVSWGLREDDIIPSFTPMFHTGGLNVFVNPLIHIGGTSILAKGFDTEQAIDIIGQARVTVLFQVPTMFTLLAASPRFPAADFSSLRYCISGGAPCPAALYQTYWDRGLAFKQGYGLTEAGPNTFYLHPDDIRRKIGSVGKPLFHIDLRIVQDDGRDAPQGQVGELLIRGPHVTPGYWNRPEATAETIVDGWLHTGDLATQDNEGFYYIVDRKKDMFISGGENVYPTEVEDVIYLHPAVLEAAVIGVADAKWGEVGRAIVTLKSGKTLTETELLDFCRERLARFKAPKSVVFAPSLPKSAANKILKRTLRDMYAKDDGGNRANAPWPR